MKMKTFLTKNFEVCDFMIGLSNSEIEKYEEKGILEQYGIDPKDTDYAEPEFIITCNNQLTWSIKTIGGKTVFEGLNEKQIKIAIKALEFDGE